MGCLKCAGDLIYGSHGLECSRCGKAVKNIAIQLAQFETDIKDILESYQFDMNYCITPMNVEEVTELILIKAKELLSN